MKISLKLQLRPAKILETLNFARENQLPADPCSIVSQNKCDYKHNLKQLVKYL